MRLVTRADFDGLICGFLLAEEGIVDSFEFIHPKDLQDSLFQTTSNDILANVPFVEGCGFWIDHHVSEVHRPHDSEIFRKTKKLISKMPSAAHIIYEYYGGADRFPQYKDLIKSIDMLDSANLSISDVICPSDWILLGFIFDPRTGLERNKFTTPLKEVTKKLILEYRSLPIKEILELPDIKERIDLYNAQNALFQKMLLENSVIKGSLVVTDLRKTPVIYTGNRFLIYSLFPGQNLSCWIINSKNGKISIACGHSIFNRSATVNIGDLMLQYGGGGLFTAGTCQVPKDEADKVIQEIVEKLQFNLITQ